MLAEFTDTYVRHYVEMSKGMIYRDHIYFKNVNISVNKSQKAKAKTVIQTENNITILLCLVI